MRKKTVVTRFGTVRVFMSMPGLWKCAQGAEFHKFNGLWSYMMPGHDAMGAYASLETAVRWFARDYSNALSVVNAMRVLP